MKAMLALLALLAASTLGDWFYGLWHGPMHLTCVGQDTWVLKREGEDRTKNETLHVKIDFRAGTVTVPNFSFFSFKRTTSDVLFFDDNKSKDTPNRGFLDRYTGETAVTEIIAVTGDEHSFVGLCHQSEPLF
jgi:hypothetical protein